MTVWSQYNRRRAIRLRHAMPDGRLPIEDMTSLTAALQSFSRIPPELRLGAMSHVLRRAREMRIGGPVLAAAIRAHDLVGLLVQVRNRPAVGAKAACPDGLGVVVGLTASGVAVQVEPRRVWTGPDSMVRLT